MLCHFRAILLAVLLTLVSASTVPANPIFDAPPDTCRCDSLATITGWCGACEVAFVGGVRLPSANFYEVLDAHGHEVNPETIRCPVCREAQAAGGYCERDRIGYVNGRAWVERLNYLLALGTPIDVSELTCGTCREHAAGAGWCATHGVGWIGPLSFTDDAVFLEAWAERKRLAESAERIATCEGCAIASFTLGRCPMCNIHYGEVGPRQR